MRKTLLTLMSISALSLILSFSIPAYAQPRGGDSTIQNRGDSTITNPDVETSGTTLVNPLKAKDLEGLLYLLLEVAVRIGVIVLTLMLIWVGFLFVAARGNEEKLRTARTAFMWTIIGGLILLGAKGIAEVIQATATSL